MKKIIFGIFAHPDDEAFGPSGTLLLETQTGTELHLITLTAGENGMNPDNHPDLGKVRLEEWRAAGQLIGATSMHHLGYVDGELGNNDHIVLARTIEQLVRDIVGDRADVAVEFMSMDLDGISGHIDHIVAARTACLVFYRLKAAGFPVTKLRLACIPRENMPTYNTDFVFMEAGREASDITQTIDARSVASEVYTIMRSHYSQRGDGESHITRLGDDVAINHFIVLS